MCSPSQPSAPSTSSTTQTAELPEWARPYAKQTLAKGAALTDIGKNPYQTYGGERIAGFQPMQQQAFQSAANMQPSEQLGLGSNLASAAGLGALGTNYQAGRFYSGQFGDRQAQQYMSPYLEEAMQPQLREAQRASDIMGQQQHAQAVGAGAFGGSRQAILDAERERNLGQQQADIRAKGYQTAYEQAANQYNQDMARRMQAQQMGEQSRQYGAGLGMQGLQTALQSAGQLGQLGQTQYGQQIGITNLQNQLGTQQQQQAQRPLDVAYQDFLNQQNYPYKQLGFMSDLIRGLPLGQKSTQSVYDQGPGVLQTLGGLGMGAYGLSKAFAKDGGLMQSYAGGGVTSPQNIENILPKLSDQQLQQAKEAALNRRDLQEAQMIDAEMAERASIRGGLGGAFNQLPQDQQEQMLAGGGIVAFASGGDTYGKKFEESLTSLQDLANQQPAPATPEQYEQGVTARQPMLERLYGPDITQKYMEETQARRAALSQQLDKDTGLAIAMAGAKLLAGKGTNQKNKLVQGISDAGEAFTSAVSQLRKENRDADDKLRQSELLLATAQQQRKEGMVNKAMSLEDKAEAQKQDAFKTKMGIQEKVAQLQSGMAGHEMQAQSAKDVANIHGQYQLGAARIAAAHPTDLDKQAEALYAAKVASDPSIASDPQRAAQAKADARQAAASQLKVGADIRANVAQEAMMDKKQKMAEESVDNALLSNSALRAQYRKLQADDKANGTDTAQTFRQGLIKEHMKIVDVAAPTAQPAPQPTPQPAPVVPGGTGTPSRAGPQTTLPPAALSVLKEGQQTTFANGQVWTLQNGQPVKVK